MERAFIVTLEIDDSSDLAVIADDLTDVISSEGYVVKSVKPWASPEQAQAQASALLSNANDMGVPLQGLGL